MFEFFNIIDISDDLSDGFQTILFRESLFNS